MDCPFKQGKERGLQRQGRLFGGTKKTPPEDWHSKENWAHCLENWHLSRENRHGRENQHCRENRHCPENLHCRKNWLSPVIQANLYCRQELWDGISRTYTLIQYVSYIYCTVYHQAEGNLKPPNITEYKVNRGGQTPRTRGGPGCMLQRQKLEFEPQL